MVVSLAWAFLLCSCEPSQSLSRIAQTDRLDGIAVLARPSAHLSLCANRRRSKSSGIVATQCRPVVLRFPSRRLRRGFSGFLRVFSLPSSRLSSSSVCRLSTASAAALFFSVEASDRLTHVIVLQSSMLSTVLPHRIIVKRREFFLFYLIQDAGNFVVVFQNETTRLRKRAVFRVQRTVSMVGSSSPLRGGCPTNPGGSASSSSSFFPRSLLRARPLPRQPLTARRL